MKTLLYFFPVKTSFVHADQEILRSKFRLFSFYFNPFPKWKTPFYLIAQFVFIILKLPRTSMMFSQFSGYHTFLPALFSRVFNIPHFIVLNGTECNNFPEINYGYINRPLLFWCSKKSLQWSTRLFPVSTALVTAEYTYTETKYVHQGFTNFYKNINTPHTVIPNGISIERFNINPAIKRVKNSFITVAAGLENKNRRIVKGLDLVLELAGRTPQNNYTFIGGQEIEGLDLPSNITIMGFVPHDELSDIYNGHQYYLQLSMTEGFGISVCEAMLCGCVPIVSAVGVLPILASDRGYVLTHKNTDLLLGLVMNAISEYSEQNSEYYRQHVIEHYSITARAQKLLGALE